MEDILYKFKKIDKYTIDILVNKRLFLSAWNTLNDSHEAQFYYQQESGTSIRIDPQVAYKLSKMNLKAGLIRKKIISPKICSLSTYWESNLLWSHYADSHSGIAIGIKLGEIPKEFKILSILYDDTVPTIKNFPLQKNDIENSLRHKSKEWEYEREIRIVSFDKSFAYLENIKIIEIIFGQKTCDEDKLLIQSLLKNEEIDYYKITQKANSYELDRIVIAWHKLS